ncbi:MAG TPA: hypothetical protein VMT95_05300 [Candidatus Binatia bacterium]|nr:hypothetical protein [Candidatus Binatia bacterium]
MSDARRANVAAAVVILLAGGLSTVWAFLVPIFQAPDEPAHFDYAISIYSAGRLISWADGTPDWIVSPYTKYLMRASDFDRIVWHSSMRVPAGYGGSAYFARVAARTPAVQAAAAQDGRINYIARYYPFGFYALEALWMRTVALFGGSLVTMFFAARLLCVFLLMAGLYFNYRTAINLNLPSWTSVALVAAVGFFPLTSLVSSYVQPDNLAYTLVSAALFFATELNRRGLQPPVVAALGLSLGLLAITKYQFFLSAAAPITFLFSMNLIKNGGPTTRRLGMLTAFAAPTAMLLAVQYFVVERPGVALPGAIHSDMNLNYFRGELAMGFLPTIGYATGTTVASFADCFVSGPCAATFWQTVGWVDTPIVILSPTAEIWIRGAISLATVAAFCLIAYFATRNALRLFRVAAHRRVGAALRVASADPVFNSYACFIAVMIALYVLTDNAFGVEGRQWYPYVFPAFLCFVLYAPRALSKRYQTSSAVLAGALLVYVLAASGYALADVRARYYGPGQRGYVAADPAPAQVLPRNAGTLAAIVSAAYHVNSRALPASFPHGSPLLVAGVAILPEARAAAPSVAVVVDSRNAVPVLSGQYLFSAAEALHSIPDGYSAFYATIGTRRLNEGAHTVSAYARHLRDGRYDRIAPTRLFFLTEADGRFSPEFLQTLAGAPSVPGQVETAGTCRGFFSVAGGVRALDAGGVALFAGMIGESRLDPYRGVWLLVDGRPYPGRFDERARGFTATVPTADLALGPHRATAYAITDRPGHPVEIAQSATFSIVPGRGAGEYLAHPPPACSDPLNQLVGLNA